MKFYIIFSIFYLNLKVFANPVTTEAVDIPIGTESTDYDEEIEKFFNDKDMVSEIIDLEEEEECTSEECIQTSKRILDNMDLSVDPCDNFYQFTCGGWEEKRNITKNNFAMLSEVTTMELRNIFKGEYKVDDKLSKEDQAYDKKLYNKLMNYYNICMNKDSYPNEHLVNFIKNFNITENKESIKEPETFTNIISKLILNNVVTFFEIDTFSNDKISDRPVISIKGTTEFYMKSLNYNVFEKLPDGFSLYKEYIKNILTILYKNDTNIDLMADNIYKIDNKILKMMHQNNFLDTINMNIDERLPESYEVLKIKELNDKYPFMDWNLYLNNIFEFYNMSEFINDDMIVFNSIPQTLKGINDLINEITVDDLASYLEWLAIERYSQYDAVSEDFLKIHKEYIEKTDELTLSLSPEDMKEVLGTYLSDIINIENNDEHLKKLIPSLFSKENNENNDNENEEITEEVDRYDNCFIYISGLMPKAISRYFVLMNYENNFMDDFKEMIENIKETMINRIPQMEWLDEETKEYAIEKVVKMKERIGYPDDIMDPKKIYQIYESLEINNYFDLVMKAYIFGYGQGLKAFNINEWLINSYVVNAYYSPYDNSINFPASIIQTPFFGYNEQDYMNYALIGSVAGHELTHAFDNNGKLYDVDGHLNNWWTDNDNEEFNEFSQCFIDEYNSITYKAIDMFENEIILNIDGKKTLEENLADNGGLARAYEAWQLSLLKNPEEAVKRNMKLPGFENYTIDQLFYIVYGQSYCSVGSFINQMDVHSPGIGRVNGVVANSEHFAKTFKCPKKSPMNPENKCHMW